MTPHSLRPEDRPVCAGGAVDRGYGRDSDQALLGVCECNAWAACEWCGEPHVWVYLCEVCASRGKGLAA